MNLIDIEDRLKDLSDQQLMQQMQRPDGMAPQFLVMSELKRRKEMRGRAPTQPDNSTVKDDLLGQGIASAIPQQPMPQQAMPQQPMPQQPMPQQPMPQDGIPRFDNGVFPVFGNPKQHTVPLFGRHNTPLTSRRYAKHGGDLSPSVSDVNELGPVVSKISPPETEEQRLERMSRGAGDVYGQNSVYSGAQLNSGRPGTNWISQDLTDANREAALNMPLDGAPLTTPTSAGANDGTTSPVPRREIPPKVAPPYSGSYDNQYGEVNAASDNQRMINQFLSAPSATSDAPAAPAQNYYEGIEKKLAALQAAETGPDAGMALLRAGLGMAQAGGEGKSTAAAIGAGGIAGLDAYEAQKKSSDARAMELLGVESELAGAKTKQSYDQQRLALDARMRDNQDKMLQLKGLNLSMEDDRIRTLAENQNQLKFMQLQLEEQKINMDADFADRKLGQMVEEGKIKGDYYEALIRKADRGDSLDRYINASPEVKALLLPILRKSNASLQGDIGEDTMKLVADPLWFANTSDRLKKAAGGGEIGINAVIMEARRQAEIGYGKRGGAPQAPRDPEGIRG